MNRCWLLNKMVLLLIILSAGASAEELFREGKMVGISQDNLTITYDPEDITCAGYYNRTNSGFTQKCNFILKIDGNSFTFDPDKEVHAIVSNEDNENLYSDREFYLEEVISNDVNDYAMECEYKNEAGFLVEYCDYDYNIFGFRKVIGTHKENRTVLTDINNIERKAINAGIKLHGSFKVPHKTKDNYNFSTIINDKEYIIPYPTYNTSNQTDFDQGTYDNTTANISGYLLLKNSTGSALPYYQNGTYTSKIYSTETSWDNLTFTALLRYGQETSIENNIVFLMHLNNGVGENSTYFKDETGIFNGTCPSGECPAYNSSGMFSSAYTFEPVDKSHILMPANSTIDFNESFSVSVWFRKVDSFSWNYVIKGQNHYFIWVRGDNKPAFVMINSSNAGKPALSSLPIEENKWTHVVGVFNHTTGSSKIFVNGLNTGNNTNVGPQSVGNMSYLMIGHNDTVGGVPGEHTLNGTIDEVILWNKALSGSEVSDLYSIGASSIKVQARTCNNINCSGEYFRGPDNLTTSYFDNESQEYALNQNYFPNKPYFQYKVFLETENTNITPALDELFIDYITNPPNITLNSPDPFTAVNTPVKFNTTVQDDTNITSVSLVGNFTGIFKINQTNFTQTIYSNFTFEANLTTGSYLWAIEACGTFSDCIRSENRTLILDDVPPEISNETYTPNPITRQNSVKFSAYIIDPRGVNDIMLSENSSGQFINWTVNDTISFEFTLSSGNYTKGDNISWRYYANDSLKNLAQGSMHTLYVNNSIPEFQIDPFNPEQRAFQFQQDSIISDQTPSINWTNAIDPDGDSINYYGKISENGSFDPIIYSFSTSAGLDLTKYNITTELNRTKTYFMRVTPSDGESNGSHATTFFKINGLPQINELNITTNEDTNLTLNLSENVTDFNDTISSISWTFTLNDTTKFNLSIENSTHILNITTYPNEYGKIELNLSAYDSLGDKNTTRTIINIDEVDDYPITVIISPQNGTIDNSGNITFIANSSDAEGLVNISLYTNITGTWGINQSLAITGKENISSFDVYNLQTGSYLWSVSSCDTNNTCISADNNFTLNIELYANESNADTAIIDGIRDSIINGSNIEYIEQRVYARNSANSQIFGLFDVATVSGNQTWAFNYISENESRIDMFNITPSLYVLEMENHSVNKIIERVASFINETKQ